ncbi:hypothetical protein BLOT_011977 [Blomia tropicalis]|nr:hypothetical protein BLOT_011977 [Blomia tropicalis]
MKYDLVQPSNKHRKSSEQTNYDTFSELNHMPNENVYLNLQAIRLNFLHLQYLVESDSNKLFNLLTFPSISALTGLNVVPSKSTN